MNIAVIDIDGVVAKAEHREAVSRREDGSMNWKKFFDPALVHTDTPVEKAQKVIEFIMQLDFSTIFITSRSHPMHDDTWNWLTEHFGRRRFHLVTKPDTGDLKFIKTPTWKALALDTLISYHQPGSLIIVDDEPDKLAAMLAVAGISTFEHPIISGSSLPEIVPGLISFAKEIGKTYRQQQVTSIAVRYENLITQMEKEFPN